MGGELIGLLVGLFFLVIYLIGRVKKEDITMRFKSEKCSDKNYIYVYWSKNNPAGKRPVPIYVNGGFVGTCRKAKIATFERPKKEFVITSLVPHNVNTVEVNEKGPIYILVNHLGMCERYYLEEENHG